MRFRSLSCAALCAGLAVPALAVDGVREINHVCATTTGCFTGDTGGYPVTITQEGSYRLTGTLTNTNVNVDVVSVTASNVTLDLNGFSVSGPSVCSEGVPVSCTPSGSGRGVAAGNEMVKGLTVKNGTVTQIGNAGVVLGKVGRVEDVRVIGAANYGIVGDDGAEIVRCTVERAGLEGIRVVDGSGALVADNTVRGVGTDLVSFTGIGIHVSEGTVRGNVVSGVWGLVIQASSSLVTGNTSVDNYGWQIDAAGRSRISGNVMDGCCYVEMEPATGYSDNVFSVPTVTGGVNLGGNLCNGVVCP
jgi:hypothetical protein